MRLVVVYFVIFFVGCNSYDPVIEQTHQFSVASHELAELSEQNFERIHQQIRLMNQQLVIINPKKNTRKLKLNRALSLSSIESRIRAAKTLAEYSQLLRHIVSDDEAHSIDNTVIALASHASSTLGRALSSSQQRILQKLIAHNTRYFIMRERVDLLRELTASYAPMINQLSRLLLDDLTLDAEGVGYLTLYQATAKQLQNAATPVINNHRRQPIMLRKEAVIAYSSAESALTHSEQFSRHSKLAIVRMQQAHAALFAMLYNKAYDKQLIGNFVQSINNYPSLPSSL